MGKVLNLGWRYIIDDTTAVPLTGIIMGKNIRPMLRQQLSFGATDEEEGNTMGKERIHLLSKREAVAPTRMVQDTRAGAG